jgi:hypothetical protein
MKTSVLMALLAAETALDDWLNTYAEDWCDPERVFDAKERIKDNGGTVAYIADTQVIIREAIANSLPTKADPFITKIDQWIDALQKSKTVVDKSIDKDTMIYAYRMAKYAYYQAQYGIK